MNLSTYIKFPNDHLRPITHKLERKMLGSLCGMVQRVSFMNRGINDASFMTAGAELTGVHILRNQQNPGPNAYHIGGGGFLQDEPLIRVYAESAERYAQLTSAIYFQSQIKYFTYLEGLSSGLTLIPRCKFKLFDEEQFEQSEFPFSVFSENATMGWIKMQSLTGKASCFVPAQFSLVGYVPRLSKGEKWMFSAVSTGSAAHIAHTNALRSGILELIQIDAAMGHWYTDAIAPKIILDSRTKRIETIIRRQFKSSTLVPEFYFLKSVDLLGLTIACVIRDSENLPAASIGLGCDMNLESSMYKALLEAVAVVQLVKLNLLYLPENDKASLSSGGEIKYLNFDSNVARYAFPIHAKELNKKFGGDNITASKLPPDSNKTAEGDLLDLIESFEKSELDIYGIDMSTTEICELGLKVVRVWSPDLLALSLPTNPQKAHSRFKKYGGCTNARPHPYP